MPKTNTPSKSCGPQPLAGESPSHAWTLEQLSAFAKQQYGRIVIRETSLAAEYWRLGQALSLARKKVKRGAWSEYLGELGIDKTRASKARAIFRCHSSSELIKDKTVEEAYEARRDLRPTRETNPADGPVLAAVDVAQTLTKVDQQFAEAIDQSEQLSQAEKRELLKHIDHAIAELEGMRSKLVASMDQAEIHG